MQRTSPPSQNGGLFKKGSIFGGGKTPTSTRPTTSNGYTNSGPVGQAESISTQGSTIFSTASLSRKASFSLSSKSPKNPYFKPRTPSAGALYTSTSPESPPELPRINTRPPTSSTSPERERKGSINYTQALPTDILDNSGSSNRDSVRSTAPYSNMLASAISANGPMGGYRPGTAYGTGSVSGIPAFSAAGPGGGPLSPTLETITYQHIQEMASKRISTLSYLRKAYVPELLQKISSTNPFQT